MIVDDLTAALSRTMKDMGLNITDVSRIELDANERKKRMRVNIAIEKKGKNVIGFWGAVVKCAPYFVVLVLGCATLWLLFGMPGCRVTNVSTKYVEKQSCVVTNVVGEVIKDVQTTKCCVTNKWE